MCDGQIFYTVRAVKSASFWILGSARRRQYVLDSVRYISVIVRLNSKTLCFSSGGARNFVKVFERIDPEGLEMASSKDVESGPSNDGASVGKGEVSLAKRSKTGSGDAGSGTMRGPVGRI